MKKILNEDQFIEDMLAFQDRRNSHNFTRLGLESLYDFLMSMDEPIDFDPYKFTCNYEEIDEEELHEDDYKGVFIKVTFKNRKKNRYLVSWL